MTGIVIGSETAALLTSVLGAAALKSWGWRVPFVAGALIAVYSFVLRRTLSDEPPAAHDGRVPIVEAVRDHWRAMLQAAGLSLVNAVAFYTVFVYVVTYTELFDHLPAAKALDINTLNMVAMLILLPFFGWLSDRVGRKTVTIGAALLLAAFAWPLFALIHSGASVPIFLGQFGFAVVIAAYVAVGPAMLVEAFPRDVRCRAVSTSYNVVLGIFGGTAPLFATYLIQRTHDDLSPAFYVMGAACISAVAIFTMPRRA